MLTFMAFDGSFGYRNTGFCLPRKKEVYVIPFDGEITGGILFNEKVFMDKRTINAIVELSKTLIKGDEVISRNLAGMLFFIYTTVSAEAEHAHYTNAVFIEAGKLEDYLKKILRDSPFN